VRVRIVEMRRRLWTRAVTKIQSRWRCRVAVDVALLRAFSVVQIQALCRGHGERKQFAIEAGYFVFCVVTVQALARRRAAMNAAFTRFHCALTIQQGCRDYLQVRAKAKKCAASVCVQRHWRGLSCRTCYDSFVYDTITVQAHFRSFLARQYVRQLLLVTREVETLSQQTPFTDHDDFIHFAATLIQAEWRRYHSRVEYFYSIAVSIVIQSVARGWLTRSTIKKYLAMLRKIEMSPGQWTLASDESAHLDR
jgi:myosin heavy subunit